MTLPEGFDYTLSGERITKPVADWMALGLRDAEGKVVPDYGRASVLLPAGAEGAAFLIFDNFHVLETYNTADAYVIAVGSLSDRLKGGPAIRHGWPRGDRALSFDEKKEMQALLLAAGFDPQGVDGIMGPNTIQAIRLWQKLDGPAAGRLWLACRADRIAQGGGVTRGTDARSDTRASQSAPIAVGSNVATEDPDARTCPDPAGLGRR